MKTRLLFLSLLSLCLTQAQGQDKDCAAKSKSVDSLVAVNNFGSAFEVWKSARKCVSESLYRSGEKILTNQLATKLPEADRADRTAMLLQLYSDYDLNFPANNNSNAVKKAMYLYRQDKGSSEIFTLLDRAFIKDRAHFTDANALHIYFDLHHKRFTAGDKTITESVLLEKTDAIIAHAEKLFADSGNNDYRKVAESIGRIAASVLPCDKRDAIYGQQFDTKKSDIDWLQAVTIGMAANCQRSAIYYKTALQWYALSPNPQTALHLAQASVQQRKGADANKYYAIAAEGETNLMQKAEIFYTMARHEITNPPKAIDLLRQSLKGKPDFGKAYLLMAEIYASTDCGKTEFEKKARYTLAAQTALKAIQADKAMKKTAESQAALYNKKAPTADEIKAAKMSGKTVAFGCGINESVTLP
jgi:hypothetical protein